LNSTQVGVEATYPLEVELSNGEEVVSAIKMSKERTKDARLYVASWDGKLRVWTVPRDDLEYELVFTLEHHGQRITEVLVSHRHFITCSDDETIRYYGLCHGDSFDKALERKVECGSRVKCLSATPGDPGVILAGLADGRVLVFEFGKIM
jgi:WD40 repeat protein